MRNIHIILAAAVLILCYGALATAQEYCYDETGQYFEVKDGFKLVQIPAHWDVADVYRESHRVKELQATDEPEVGTVVVCDDDVLVISPSTCTPP